jgi:RNA polymerase sigma-70 factor (ECF subfamily)
MEPGDEDLVRQVRAGNHTAFRPLVDRHSRRVYHMAFRMTGNREDAEDVVQETFVRAFRQIGRFESRSSFSTWLYRIGVNSAIDQVAKRRRNVTSEANEVLDGHHHPAVVDGFRHTFGGQVAERIQAALRALTPQERAAFVMRHYDDCSIDEIGRALGLNTSAAKHSVFRAVQKLRRSLQPFVTVAGKGSDQ